MKRSICFMLAVFLCISMIGCTADSPTSTTADIPTESTHSEEPSVETTVEFIEETTVAATEESTEVPTETTHTHSYEPATCKTPKTCTTCGKTKGSAASHDYEDGVCTWCGKVKSTSSEKVWIPTKGGKKYHKNKTCSNMDDPEQVTKKEAEELGFDPCKKCYK